MDGDDRYPPRKRARLSIERPSEQETEQETTVPPSTESSVNEHVSFFRSFLTRSRSQPTLVPSPLDTRSAVEAVEEEVQAPPLPTEESNTDDEDLQQLGMNMYENSMGIEASYVTSDLSYEDILQLLFHSSRENKEMVFDKVFRMIKRTPQGIQVIQRLVTAEEESGLTLLMIAVKNDNLPLCQTLMNEGANVNQYNEKRPYALMLAAQKGFIEISRFLLEHGANEESKSMALIPAAHFGHLEIAQLLMEYGANENYANKKGTTPLMRAAQEGRENVVQYLVDKGAIASAANHEGMTALMLAAQRGHAGIATALIRYGSDVNTQTRQGSTALLLAAKRGHTAAVEALLTAGADIFLTDDRHKTAAEIAHRRGHVDLFLKITVMNQLHLMRDGLRRERYTEIMRLSHLFVLSRAQLIETPHRRKMHLLFEKTMKLPRPLLQNVALFLPLCPVWDRQLRYLMYETTSHHSSRVVLNGIRMMDEMLQSAALEVCSTLYHLRQRQSTTGYLTLFRDCLEFRQIFVKELSLPFNDSILTRLRPMADLQGVLSSWGVGTAVSYGPEVAQDVVSLLADLLGWNVARKLMERRS